MPGDPLATPGTTRFTGEGFEGLDFRWRDPNEAPDTSGDVDGRLRRATLVPTPGGPGAPEASTFAMQVTVDWESAGANALVFAHEVLASNIAPSVPDLNATAMHFDATTELGAHVFTTGAPGLTMRMLALDADRELESSAALDLSTPGWRRMSWDLTDAGSISGFTTTEPAFVSGDGLLDTAGAGTRDLSLFGFVFEGNGALQANIVLDELTREHRSPGGASYLINELRYADPSAEFVEIHGPAGPLPAGTELRVYGSSAIPFATHALSGSIADDGGGFGFFVVGDPNVPNVDHIGVFASGHDDLLDGDPSAVQLVGAR